MIVTDKTLLLLLLLLPAYPTILATPPRSGGKVTKYDRAVEDASSKVTDASCRAPIGFVRFVSIAALKTAGPAENGTVATPPANSRENEPPPEPSPYRRYDEQEISRHLEKSG